MNKKNSYIGIILVFITLVLQTTILVNISFRGIKPDFVLIMIILMSNNMGSIKGQLLGFFIGIIEDFVSLSPLGFNSLIKAILGYLAGKTAGKIFFDPILVPVIFVFLGTLIKKLLTFILLLIYIPEKSGFIFTSALLIEIALNIIITPLLYLILKLLRALPFSNNSRIL